MAGKQVAHAQPQEQKSEERKSTRAETTLEAWGPRLPCGLGQGTNLNKDFVCRPMKTADERVLAKLKKSNTTMGAYVSMILGQQMETFAGIDLAKLKPAEKMVRLGQCYMGDIFYAYVWLRRETMGDDLKMQIICSGCPGKEFEWVGKLGSIQVATVADERDLEWSYVLRRPIEVRKKRVTKLRMKSPLWGFATQGNHGNEDLAKLQLVRTAVNGLNDDPEIVDFQDSELDELSKLDLDLLTNSFEPHWLGPNMSIEGSCPNCDREFKRPISWQYESFFGASSV